MSADRPTPEADGPHLDELASSAALDGEATPEDQAHLDGCAACRAGVERLRAVQARLAATASTAPDPTRRERAIAAALAASEPQAASQPRGRAAPLVPSLRPGHRRRRRSADLAPWLGVAAVVLLVALAVPLLSGTGADDSDEAASGTGSATSATEESGGTAADESTVPAAPPVEVGDLGPLQAGDDLRPVVERALGGGESEGGGEAGGGEAGDAEREAEAAGGSSGGGAEEDDPEPLQSGAADATTTTGDDGDDVDGGAPSLAAGPDEAAAAACEPSVRSSLPDAGALLLTGTATVDGAPALVYGFAAPSDRPTVLVALVAEAGCRIVTVQAHARD